MNGKRVKVLIALATVLSVLLVPMIASDDAEAISTEDLSVSIPGYDIVEHSVSDGRIDLTIDMTMNNGKSKDVLVYVLNKSDKIVNIGTSGDKTGEVTSSATVDNNTLVPSEIEYGLVTATITAGQYANEHTTPTEVIITVTDIDGWDNPTVTITVHVNVDVVSTFYSDDSYNKIFGIIPNTLPAPLDNPWISAAITMVLWILATIVVSYIIIPLLTRLVGVRKSPTEKDSLKKSLTKMITLIMIIIAINECAQIVGAGPSISHTISSVSNVFYVLIGATIAWQVYIFIVTAMINGLDETVEIDGIDGSLIPLFKMIGKLAISVTAVAMILASFGVDLGGILVSAGVVSLGITLGAQNTLNQFFSGIVLLATRPFKKGDFVRINTDTYIVHKVKLMFTEFENWDKDQIVTMPNNVVSSATIVNLTRDSPHTRIFVYVSVAYNADLSLAKELMIRAAKMHPHVIVDNSVTPPGTRLTNFLGSGIEYRLACYVDDFDNSSHYAGQIREIIYKLFLDNGIEIPYNRLEVTMLEPCDGKRKESDKFDD